MADITSGEIWRYVSDLAIVSANDLVFAAGLGVVGQCLLAASARRPRLQTVVWRGLLALYIVCAFYAMLSIHVFGFLRRPLTYQLLYVAGDMTNMRDSIAVFLTPSVVAGLLGVPVLSALLVWWLTRRAGRDTPPHRRWRPWFAGVLVAGPVVWCGIVHASILPDWGTSHDERQIARNPHYALVSSMVTLLLGGGGVVFDTEFEPGDLDDFRPAGERDDGGKPTPGLRRGPRNVILVVLESVGTQHMSLYGGRYPTMPRLEREARHALVVDHFYAHITNTANSLVTLCLGVYPSGLSWREPTRETPQMPGTSLAQVLKARGYRTAFISSGDNEYAGQENFLANRGFDIVHDWRNSGRERLFSWGVEDEAMVDMTFRFVDQDRAKPFFVMTWNQCTHHPYQIPWEKEKIDFFKGDIPHDDWDLGNYLSALHEVDLQLQRLFDGLRQRGLAEDTFVVITGDHGEAFGVPHPNYGHSYHVYEEDVHVPLVLWNPKLFGGASRSAVIGGHVDLGPTILDLLDVALPSSWQGRSLFSPSHPRRAYSYGALDHYLLAVREGSFKYILNVSEGEEELYDLGTDPSEQTNRSRLEPTRCERLRQRLAAWFHSQTQR